MLYAHTRAMIHKIQTLAGTRSFVLQEIQPGIEGFLDGTISTLAPVITIAFLTQRPSATFLVGMAAAVGSGISMGFAEGLSDDGSVTGRGNPIYRGSVSGGMTFLGAAIHTFPFLLPHMSLAMTLSCLIVACQLACIAAVRHHFYHMHWRQSIVQVIGGGVLVFLVALIFGQS